MPAGREIERKEEANFWRPDQPGRVDISPKAGLFPPSPEEETVFSV
jgi:hypothetical protein